MPASGARSSAVRRKLGPIELQGLGRLRELCLRVCHVPNRVRVLRRVDVGLRGGHGIHLLADIGRCIRLLGRDQRGLGGPHRRLLLGDIRGGVGLLGCRQRGSGATYCIFLLGDVARTVWLPCRLERCLVTAHGVLLLA